MVADVTETRNVIPSLEFKTCTANHSNFFKLNCLNRKFEAMVQLHGQLDRGLLAKLTSWVWFSIASYHS